MSAAIGTPAAIGQPLNSAFLITIKDLVTTFQGFTPSPKGEKVLPMCPVQSVTYVSGREMPTSRQTSAMPSPASRRATNCSRSSITEHWLDVSSAVHAGADYIAVELDNRPTAQTIPGFALRLRAGNRIWYDWWHYGGIVRDVWFTISLHLQVTFLDAKGDAQGATALDAYPLNFSGQRVEDMKQTPH
jgi:hypothetical protein